MVISDFLPVLLAHHWHMLVTFNGIPDKVALFLGQVIDHLDQYVHFYSSQWAMVMAVAAVLEDEAANWVANLYSEHGQELRNTGLF